MTTLVVSLEAIFLSTLVLIGQNRQASFQIAKADHDFNEQTSPPAFSRVTGTWSGSFTRKTRTRPSVSINHSGLHVRVSAGSRGVRVPEISTA